MLQELKKKTDGKDEIVFLSAQVLNGLNVKGQREDDVIYSTLSRVSVMRLSCQQLSMRGKSSGHKRPDQRSIIAGS